MVVEKSLTLLEALLNAGWCDFLACGATADENENRRAVLGHTVGLSRQYEVEKKWRNEARGAEGLRSSVQRRWKSVKF